MKLKSFGCSLIFGTELFDESYPKYSQQTWPALLANHLGLEYECHAQPGSGNLQILEKVLSQVASGEPSVFVIGWTWIDRFDYCNPIKNLVTEKNFWKTITPSDSSQLSNTYYKELSSEFRDKLSTLIYMSTALTQLQQNSINFIMTYMDPWLFERRWHVTPGILNLQNQIEPRLTTFDNLNFLDWSRKHQYPETKLWHPLEEAHTKAFQYMIDQYTQGNLWQNAS